MVKIIILILLSQTIVLSQPVYKVTPGVKGNQIDLTVANTSLETELNEIKIDLVKQPISCAFANESQTINRIEKNDSVIVTFLFDAARIVDVAKTDTIKFVIKDDTGSEWEKEILIGYAMPEEFRLEQNYPNPFNPTTTIEFTIPRYADLQSAQSATHGGNSAASGNSNRTVTLKVYDILGREVAALINEPLSPGYYKAEWNASNFASGVYIYRLVSKDVSIVRKMMIVK